MFFFLALSISFTVTFFLMPIVIKTFKSINLLDIPDKRKLHSVNAPSFGGIAIFIGFILSLITTIGFADIVDLKYFFSGMVMIFLLGVRDDISSLEAKQKFSVQVLAAIMTVYLADTHFIGLYGLFGLSTLPFGIDKVISVIAIVGFTNSFNLIDGIDGLAASLGLLALSVLGWGFLKMDMIGFALVSFALSGSLVAFLFYNWFPSRVFMGDTGSMLLGFMIAVLIMAFLNGSLTNYDLQLDLALPLVLSILIIPLYDTLKVFIIRIINGRSPFFPDRNHVHHGLLKIGFNHAESTSILVFFTLICIITSFSLYSNLTTVTMLAVLVTLVLAFGICLDFLVSKRKYVGKNLSVSHKSQISNSKRAS